MQITTNKQQSQRSEGMSQVSLLKGYWFYFDHEGNDISFHSSSMNGKETVYFNNKPVSHDEYNGVEGNKHTFEENGHQYLVQMQVDSLLRGAVNVSVYCDGKLIAKEATASIKDKNIFKAFFDKELLYACLGCIAIAYAAKYLGIIDWIMG